MNELDKLRNGEPFDGWAPEVVAQRDLVAQVLQRVSTAPLDQRADLYREILGGLGDGSVIQVPFVCEFGVTITIGRRCFLNSGVTVLDGDRVTIGDHVLIGPNCQIYTAGHPLDYRRRRDWEVTTSPVTIEDDVWLGGNVIVQPGVTVGARSVVAAGSVVTRDIPPDSLALGSPARVIRTLTSEPPLQ